MRLIVFFDLPVLTVSQRKQYRMFRKYLVKNGYLMLQESVYAKLAINGKVVDSLVRKLYENRPPEGLVQVLTVTEHEFARMENIVGVPIDDGTNATTDELIVL